MVVKAYLRSDEEAIPLTFDYTTIGRSESCDVVIQVKFLKQFITGFRILDLLIILGLPP